ncbi:UNVERIFIED_ORG: phage tail protein [Clostridium botulinum]
MYENITFESILQRMISKVPDTLDKREGSIIYNALAPAAVELQNMYIELDVILNETFADTASRKYLIKRAAERGVTPDKATYAILKGEFNIDIPIGSRFSCDDLNYKAIEKIGDHKYKLQCETLGVEGNKYFGELIPIEYIQGLETAKLTELLIPGQDEEETESLRQRYYNTLESESFGGNVADYKEKVNKISGVGGVKVYRTWNGGGTVKLVIINSNFKKPSSELINSTQTIIDPTKNQGEGLGIAPIGHVVTVLGVEEETINITSTITYQEGWDFEASKQYIEKAVDDYFSELNKTWADNDNLIIRISQIETRLLNVAGILDIANTSINGVQENYVADKDSIVKRGEIVG